MNTFDKQLYDRLLTASNALLHPSPLPKLIETAAHQAAELLGAHAVALAVIDKKGPPTMQGMFGCDAPAAQAVVAVALKALQNKRGVVAVDDEPSTLATLLTSRGKAVAILAAQSGGAPFDDAQKVTLALFANMAAAAIETRLSNADLISIVTHELRLPLTSIKGYSDILRGGMAGEVSESQKQLLQTIRNNADWMNTLISDLSDISKIEAGRLLIEAGEIDVAASVNEAITAVRPQIDSRSQTLTVDLPSLPSVLSDPRRVVQLTADLLTNASMYTAANGHITVRAQSEAGTVRVSVTDTGVGISADDLPKLFTPFFRSEHPVVREHKGWGLSLHLAKMLAETLGGDLGVETTLNSGSTFWFTLPTSAA